VLLQTFDNLRSSLFIMKRCEFESLYNRLFEKLCHKVYPIVNDKDSAKDIVQVVFIKFWKTQPNLKVDADSYLYKAVVNQALNYLDSHSRRTSALRSMGELTSAPGNNVEQTISELELKEKIERVLNTLPPACKRVFILSRFEGMSYKSIAAFLNISENTVDNQIKHALKQFRHHLLALLSFFVNNI